MPLYDTIVVEVTLSTAHILSHWLEGEGHTHSVVTLSLTHTHSLSHSHAQICLMHVQTLATSSLTTSNVTFLNHCPLGSHWTHQASVGVEGPLPPENLQTQGYRCTNATKAYHFAGCQHFSGILFFLEFSQLKCIFFFHWCMVEHSHICTGFTSLHPHKTRAYLVRNRSHFGFPLQGWAFPRCCFSGWESCHIDVWSLHVSVDSQCKILVTNSGDKTPHLKANKSLFRSETIIPTHYLFSVRTGVKNNTPENVVWAKKSFSNLFNNFWNKKVGDAFCALWSGCYLKQRPPLCSPQNMWSTKYNEILSHMTQFCHTKWL